MAGLGKVAESGNCSSPQPRIRVLERVAKLLEGSGRTDAGIVIGFTHRGLACEVYGVDDPTAAQLSAVRRAVAKLVAAGRAERGQERVPPFDMPWAVDGPRSRHHRTRGAWTYSYGNPGGVLISRVPTEEDRRAREAWLGKAPSLAERDAVIGRRKR
jgi:hypothetical protein